GGGQSRGFLFAPPGTPAPALARRLGAGSGKTRALDQHSDAPRQQQFARHIVRHTAQRPVWEAGFARSVYVGEGGAPPGKYRMDKILLPKGVAVRGDVRPAGGGYFVLGGCVCRGWGGGRGA